MQQYYIHKTQACAKTFSISAMLKNNHSFVYLKSLVKISM